MIKATATKPVVRTFTLELDEDTTRKLHALLFLPDWVDHPWAEDIIDALNEAAAEDGGDGDLGSVDFSVRDGQVYMSRNGSEDLE